MISFKKILVPVDFSEPSKKALTYGFTLATQFNSQLLITHIVPESSALMYAFPTEMWKVEKEQHEKARREIDTLVRAEYASKLNLQTIIKIGSIEGELLGIVTDEAVDLVVMGTHGRRNLGRWFIGSVTEHLLRKVPAPVLTVSHVGSEEHAVGLVSLKQILYATDFSESSTAGLKYAIELARGTGARLTVMHVVDHDDRILWGPALITHLENERAKLVQEIRKKLAELIAREKPPDIEIEPLVVEGKSFRKIVEVAEQRGMDIIVLNLQSKSMLERALLGSTAERVVRLARTPVLSVPAS